MPLCIWSLLNIYYLPYRNAACGNNDGRHIAVIDLTLCIGDKYDKSHQLKYTVNTFIHEVGHLVIHISVFIPSKVAKAWLFDNVF